MAHDVAESNAAFHNDFRREDITAPPYIDSGSAQQLHVQPKWLVKAPDLAASISLLLPQLGTSLPPNTIKLPPVTQTTVKTTLYEQKIPKVARNVLKLPGLSSFKPAQHSSSFPQQSNQTEEADQAVAIPEDNSMHKTKPNCEPSMITVEERNREYIRELEAKKKKEQKILKKKEAQRIKYHEKMTRKLYEAARQRQSSDQTRRMGELFEKNEPLKEVETGPAYNEELMESNLAHQKRHLKTAQRQLLKKQQVLLDSIVLKKKEKEEALLIAIKKEKKRQEKLKKNVLVLIQENIRRQDKLEIIDNAIDASEDDNTRNNKPMPTRSKKARDNQTEDATPTPEEVLLLKQQNELLLKKQQDYLVKISEQRKQKEREDEEKQHLLNKKRKKTQLEAMQRLREAAEASLALRETTQAEEKSMEVNSTILASEEVDAMVRRLSQLTKRDAEVVPEARDFNSWKKRHNVALQQKVFCLTGWYPVIRQELENRGWYYNTDKDSRYFDLKWSLKSDDLKTHKLQKDQFVNHFFQNTALTTKVGLLHSLRRLKWHQPIELDTFFPRAYDLNEADDMDNFIQEFRYGKAESMIKDLLRYSIKSNDTHGDFSAILINEGVFGILVNAVMKKLKSLHYTIGDDSLEESVDSPLQTCGEGELVSDLEWEVLRACSCTDIVSSQFYDHIMNFKYSPKYNNDNITTDGRIDMSIAEKQKEKKLYKVINRAREQDFHNRKIKTLERLKIVSPLSPAHISKIKELIKALQEHSPQFYINGGYMDHKSKNIWIVKPAGMSRGRGIRVFNDLTELLSYIDVENHQECQWVTQKYIETPLLIGNKKFDIRQWVLVTCWDPLTIWFHNHAYCRLSSQDYSVDDLNDTYVHLTNNSIQKYSDAFNDVYSFQYKMTEGGADNVYSTTVEGHMIHSDDFQIYLTEKLKQPPGLWKDNIQHCIKEIVIYTLQCVQDKVEHRSNSCELYGYDFMLDENYQPWLIEVNSSPACDYSTPVAKRYVEEGLSGIIKVIVDYREYENQKRKGMQKLIEPDTGVWQRIHRGGQVGQPISSLGADFQVMGEKLSRRSRRSRAKNAFGSLAIDIENLAQSTANEPNKPVVEKVPVSTDEQNDTMSDMLNSETVENCHDDSNSEGQCMSKSDNLGSKDEVMSNCSDNASNSESSCSIDSIL